MRDPKRIDGVLKKIEQIWKKYPDLRFGQLILNVSDKVDLYYMEDEDFLKLIEATYAPISQNKC